MTQLDRIEERLSRLEELLERLVGKQVDPLAGLPDSSRALKQEIAAVRAAGGDLIKHFQAKGRAKTASSRAARRGSR